MKEDNDVFSFLLSVPIYLINKQLKPPQPKPGHFFFLFWSCLLIYHSA